MLAVSFLALAVCTTFQSSVWRELWGFEEVVMLVLVCEGWLIEVAEWGAAGGIWLEVQATRESVMFSVGFSWGSFPAASISSVTAPEWRGRASWAVSCLILDRSVWAGWSG